MLVIRQAQMATLQQLMWQRDLIRIEARLRQAFPSHLESVAEPLREHLRRALESAAHFQLETEPDCWRFLKLCVRFGWDFLDRPGHSWIRKLLTDPRVSTPSARLDLVEEWIERREAAAAANQATAAAFGD